MKVHLVSLTLLLLAASVGLYVWGSVSAGFTWLYAVDHYSVYRAQGAVQDSEVGKVIGDTQGDWVKGVDYLIQKPLLDARRVTHAGAFGLLALSLYSGYLARLEFARTKRAQSPSFPTSVATP